MIESLKCQEPLTAQMLAQIPSPLEPELTNHKSKLMAWACSPAARLCHGALSHLKWAMLGMNDTSGLILAMGSCWLA